MVVVGERVIVAEVEVGEAAEAVTEGEEAQVEVVERRLLLLQRKADIQRSQRVAFRLKHNLVGLGTLLRGGFVRDSALHRVTRMRKHITSQVKTYTAERLSLRFVYGKGVGNPKWKLDAVERYSVTRPTLAVKTMRGIRTIVFSSGMRTST